MCQISGGPHQAHNQGRRQISKGREDDGASQCDRYKLGGVFFGALKVLMPHQLRQKGGTCNGQAHPHGNEEKVHRPDKGRGCKVDGGKSAYPESIGQVVQGLNQAIEDDWYGESGKDTVHITPQDEFGLTLLSHSIPP